MQFIQNENFTVHVLIQKFFCTEFFFESKVLESCTEHTGDSKVKVSTINDGKILDRYENENERYSCLSITCKLIKINSGLSKSDNLLAS